MRRPIIVGNWKMHKTTAEAVTLVQALKAAVAGMDDVDIGVAPPFTALMAVAQALQGSAIFVVAQNMHWEPQGAFTGEIAETDDTVNKKLRAALNAGLEPILCIGETLEQREANATFQVLEQQIRLGLAEIAVEGMRRAVIAYEPIWAIGTGKTATPAQAQEVHVFIRDLLGTLYGKPLADEVRIQYGGSVNAGNIQALMTQPDIDGALVGGASLDTTSFAQIVSFQRR